MNRKQVQLDDLDNDPAPANQPEWVGVIVTVFVVIR
jgi:hypothetical protein